MRGTFIAFWSHGPTNKNELAGLLVCWDIERLTIQHLKLHKVNMQRMDIASDVDEGPDLSTAGLGVFGNGFVPTCITEEARNDVAVGGALFF